MSTSICTDGCEAVSHTRYPLTDASVRMFAGLLRFWTARRNRSQVARLTQADDRMLADIGLTSSDVRAALAAPFGEDPSMVLLRSAQERRVARREAMRENAAELPRSTVLVSFGWTPQRDTRRQR